MRNNAELFSINFQKNRSIFSFAPIRWLAALISKMLEMLLTTIARPFYGIISIEWDGQPGPFKRGARTLCLEKW